MIDIDSQPLHDLVARQIDRQWLAWAQAHPNLARVIDRTRLIEVSVRRLRDDPAYRAALARADCDERALAEAARLVELIEKAVGVSLAL